MHRFIPLSDEDRRAMYEVVGATGPDDLFAVIPEQIRRCFDPGELNETGMSERAVEREVAALARRNADPGMPRFLGAGAYERHVPAVVDHVTGRSEFYTAYTPYQAEVGQGTLQAIFEYQSTVCALTGLDVSNASHYDGSTALAEAALMACAGGSSKRILVSRGVHPRRRAVLATYARAAGLELVEVPLVEGRTDGSVDAADAAGFIVQQPNFLGVVEDLTALRKAVPVKTVFVAAVDPVSLGLLTPPGEAGVDIAVGDGLGCGLRLNAGGPGLGFMAVTKKLMRKMPGRVVGRTVDLDGKTAFVLTLQAREQHIRRAGASSNICSNQALCALAFTVYMSLLGKTGLTKLAELEFHRAHHTRRLLLEAGFTAPIEAPFFNEFPVTLRRPVATVNEALRAAGMVGGYDLGRDYPELAGSMLVAVTEAVTLDDVDRFVGKVREIHG